MEILLIGFLLQGLIFGFFCSYIAGEKRRSKSTWFWLGFFFSILAVLALIAIPKLERSADSDNSDRREAKLPANDPRGIQTQAEVLFDGERDVSTSAYQLFLIKRYAIEKNATLEKFVIGNDVFDDLSAVLNDADARYGQHLQALAAVALQLESEANAREQNRRLASERAQTAARERSAEVQRLQADRIAAARRARPWLIVLALTAMVVIGYFFLDYLAQERKTRLSWQATGIIVKDCSECPEMIAIPGGTFEMGSNESREEQPVHSVKVADFLLGRTEVTQGQWKAIMGENPSRFSDCGMECPVESVTWGDAQEFAKKLSQRTGNDYRLPSEAEWEYAARANSRSIWSFGDDESYLAQFAWFKSNSGGQTHPVAQKAPNIVGLHDVHGNVWEWVEDVAHEHYRGAPLNGSAWTDNGDKKLRVVRGGNWNAEPRYLRTSIRLFLASGDRYDGTGLRIARTP